MWVLSLEDPLNPAMEGYCHPGGFVESVYPAGNLAYVANADAGVALLRVYGFDGEPPRVTGHPQSQTIYGDSPTLLNVKAVGSEPFQYQWYLNGQPVSGGTGSVLQLIGAARQEGLYSVGVSNQFGGVLSRSAHVEYFRAPEFSQATVVLTSTNSLRFSSTLQGQPGVLYVLESAGSLQSDPWTFVRYCTGASNPVSFSDAVATPSRFYRARVVSVGDALAQ